MFKRYKVLKKLEQILTDQDKQEFSLKTGGLIIQNKNIKNMQLLCIELLETDNCSLTQSHTMSSEKDFLLSKHAHGFWLNI